MLQRSHGLAISHAVQLLLIDPNAFGALFWATGEFTHVKISTANIREVVNRLGSASHIQWLHQANVCF